MLSSSELVLQVQRRSSSTGMISDSEESKGYLSEGEQYRRSRFPRHSKSTNDINVYKVKKIPGTQKFSTKQDNGNIIQNSTHLIYEDVFLKKRAGRLNQKTTKEAQSYTTSDSEISEIENSCPFYFSPIHQHNKVKHRPRKKNEKNFYKTGNLQLKIFKQYNNNIQKPNYNIAGSYFILLQF